MTDCLIIGFNDIALGKYRKLLSSMGEDSGSFRDLDLALVYPGAEPRHSLGLFTELHHEGRAAPEHPLQNIDFLWPTITYLGSYLDRRGFAFDYINLFQQEKESLAAKLRQGDVLTVAITTTLYVIPEPILEVLEFVRRHASQARIIVGGPYISNNTSTLNSEALQRFFEMVGADIYVDSSEGEQALVEILTALKGDGDLGRIDNIAFRSGDGYTVTNKSVERSSLAEEMVRYDLFPPEEIGQFVSLRTAKSCPFSCAFCGFPARAGKYTYLDVDRVEEELDALQRVGQVSSLSFLDDTFNVPQVRFKELLRMMIRKDYGFRWNSFYRSDHGDDETIDLMAAAGCEGVFLGVESGSDTILKKMKKTARREHYLRAIPLLKERGIVTHANLIIGFPGETEETFQQTMDFIEMVKPDFFRAQLWYADPVTPVWRHKEELGIHGEAFHWSHDTMDWRTAADLVDKMFCGIKDSIWLPQYGFELWSIFYLQRFGLSINQIKAYLSAFNAMIRQRLTGGGREPDPDLIEAARRAAQFDRALEPTDPAPLERHGADAYDTAERFWCEMFRDAVPLDLAGSGGASLESATCSIAEETCRQLETTLGCVVDTAALAAFVTLLVRVSGTTDAMLLAESRGELVPLRVRAAGDRSFRDLVRDTERLHTEGRSRLAHAPHFLRNRERLAHLYSAEPPVFEAAFVHGGTASCPESDLMSDIQFFLVVHEEAGLQLDLRTTLPRADTEQLVQLLAAMLEEAAALPDQPLACLSVMESTVSEPVVHDDASEAFQF